MFHGGGGGGGGGGSLNLPQPNFNTTHNKKYFFLYYTKFEVGFIYSSVTPAYADAGGLTAT